MFNIVKNYYNNGVYSDADVAKFVKAGKLTAADYEKITGKSYIE